jgi:phage shock protein C
MSIAEEIERLESLRQKGTLTDQEFIRAKEQLLAGRQPILDRAANSLHSFHRSDRDRVIGGVCGGLGEYTPIPAWIWRILFCAAVLFLGFGVVVYLLLWIFAPGAESSVS